MEVEHNVKLGDRREEAVEELDKEVDALERCQLVVAIIDAHDEEEVCIPSEDELVLVELHTASTCDAPYNEGS